MDRPSHDYADARNMMVDSQVRPNKVYDSRLIAAMRRLPRERFVPPQAAARAYADEDVPLGNGRVLTEPMVIARLIELAALRHGERVLVVGSGTGYAAAVLAACGAVVTALEEDESLIAMARTTLAGIAQVSGPLAEGWPAAAPYDLVLIDGAADVVPAAIIGQIRTPGGRLIGILAGAGRLGRAVVGEPVAGGLSFQPAFDCATPLLPALRRPPAFVF